MASSGREVFQTKQEFFDALDTLLDADDDEDCDYPKHSNSTINKHALSSIRSRLVSETSLKPPLAKSPPTLPSASAETYKAIRTKRSSQTMLASGVLDSKDANHVGHAASDSTMTSSSTRSVNNTSGSTPTSRELVSSIPLIGKVQAKKQCKIKFAPEEKQIFRGLTFYFLPNNELDPSRRARIILAIEYGAIWLREFHSSVTHIIVDEHVTYSEVLKHLGFEYLPVGMAVVLPSWQSDSIEWCQPLKVHQKRYQVRDSYPQGFDSHRSTLQEAPSLNTSKRHSLEYLQRHCGKSLDRLYGEVAASNPSNSSEEMEQAILEARSMASLPFDSDSEDTSSTHKQNPIRSRTTGSERSSDSKENERELPSLRSTTSRYQQRFACMRGGTHKEDCVNEKTIQVLQQMCDYYESVHDIWRPIAYRKAITTLRHHPELITTKEEAEKLPNIGTRLAEKIEEIFWTSRLRRLDTTSTEMFDVALKTFLQIYGVGLKQASAWVQQGFRTIEELRTNVHLTRNQLIGIEHFNDFQSRIPRSEITELGQYVEHALLKLDPKFQLIIGGSYRRGAKDSGDIDLIITKAGATIAEIRTFILDTLVPQLSEQGFLKVALADTSREGGTKWQGACALPDSMKTDTRHRPWRRIDLLLVPWEELGAALLYFTGNDIFNRSMRLLARRNKMRLNQRGLFRDIIRGPGNSKVTEGTKVEGRNERRIFEILNVPWREPEERNC